METLRSLIQSPASLHAFEAAGRHLSFTKAAQELNVSQAAISYAVKQLEQALGVTLFYRRHRRIEFTEAGARFFQDVSMGLTHIRKSAEAIAQRRGEHHVALSVSTAFAHYWMVPRMADFRAANPNVDLRLETTDKDIDLRAEGIPLGIRRGLGEWAGYESAFLAPEQIMAVASSRYLERFGRPRSLAELAGHKLLHLDEPYRPRPTWAEFFAAQGVAFADSGTGLRLNDYALVIQAALAGEGIAFGWRHIVEGLLIQGLLERVTDACFDEGYGFYVLWAEGAVLSGPAAAVRDWLISTR
jgi:DNA-binding transcriptional LysR family regulator